MIAPNRHTPLKTRHVLLNFIIVPLLSVLSLLVSGVFTGRTVQDGIVGTSGIRPLRTSPSALLLFAFLMFILVQGLSTLDWVELFARW